MVIAPCRRGFTLLELATVLLVASVALAMALPSARRVSDRAAVAGAREAIVGMVSVARAEALAAGSAELVVDTRADRVWVETEGRRGRGARPGPGLRRRSGSTGFRSGPAPLRLPRVGERLEPDGDRAAGGFDPLTYGERLRAGAPVVTRRRGPLGGPGFSLVEIVVALVVLEIGLLAVVGLSVLAARTAADAAELQRAMGSLEVVVDSLSGVRSASGGERLLPPHRVRWWREDGVLRVRVERPTAAASPVVEVDLPLAGG